MCMTKYCDCSFFFFFSSSFFYSFDGGGEGWYLNETIKDLLIGNKNWTILKCYFFTFLMNMRIEF